MDDPRRQWLQRLAILLGTGGFLLLMLVIFREVLVPFVIAVVIAYVLNPLVERVHRWKVGARNVPRWTAVLGIYAVLFGILTVFATTLLPRLGTETAALVRATPGMVAQLQDEWIPEAERWVQTHLHPHFGAVERVELPDEPSTPAEPSRTSIRVRPVEGGGYEVVLPSEGVFVDRIDDHRYRIGPARRAQSSGALLSLNQQLDDAIARVLAQSEEHALTALRYTQRAVFLTVEFVFNAILSLMLAGFILATMPTVMGFFRSLFPPKLRPDFDQLVKRVDRGLGGVVRGQLLICLINGVLSGVGFALAGLRYWPVWTLLATVMSIVPIFGTIISSVPAVAVGLSQGWGTGLFVLIWIIAIHELEANIFNPKIMGDAARMHPVIVIFALLAGAHAAGVLGALLGVPVASILQSLFRFLRARAYDEDGREIVCHEVPAGEGGGEDGAPDGGPGA